MRRIKSTICIEQGLQGAVGSLGRLISSGSLAKVVSCGIRLGSGLD